MEQQNLIHGRTATPIAPSCDHPAPFDSCALQAEYIDIAANSKVMPRLTRRAMPTCSLPMRSITAAPCNGALFPRCSLAAT